MSESLCVTSLRIDLLSRMFLFNPLISPRSYFVSFYVNSSKETAVLHQQDEPGDLPITLTVLGVTVAYLGLSCAWFSPGESQDFFQ